MTDLNTLPYPLFKVNEGEMLVLLEAQKRYASGLGSIWLCETILCDIYKVETLKEHCQTIGTKISKSIDGYAFLTGYLNSQLPDIANIYCGDFAKALRSMWVDKLIEFNT